jgi:hypothetical protein
MTMQHLGKSESLQRFVRIGSVVDSGRIKAVDFNGLELP